MYLLVLNGFYTKIPLCKRNELRIEFVELRCMEKVAELLDKGVICKW